MKVVPPSTNETAFNCPHCGALAKQFWFSLRADANNDDHPLPIITTEGDGRDWTFSEIEESAVKQSLIQWAKQMREGRPFL